MQNNFIISQLLLACHDKCNNCVDTATKCLACKGNRNGPPDCKCPRFTLQDSELATCPSCYYKCSLCSAVTFNCIECA